MRPSPVAIVAGVILAGFTIWITHQAKALERDLDANSLKIALLDKPAPDFHLTSFDGRPVSLAGLRGKKLVLMFWATWNNTSHPEMLMLSMTYDRARTTESDFNVVAVAVDDDQTAVRKFAADSRIPFPLVLDHNRDLANAYRIRSIPTALIIDGDGKIVYGVVGAQRNQGEFARQLGISPRDFRMELGAPRGRGN
ncbi:MAG TPA: TlpA disulfide reductase family protein [Bryobacteraceae bacterium]|nr:TlpA disulfide reductase family protein [Bryobacteraceae bacterium]